MSLLPFKNKYVRVRVDGKLISVVELTGLEIVRNGRVEAKYGYIPSADGTWHSSRRHSKGPTFARFSIRRWFKTGLQQPLFFSIHNDKTYFNIQQFLTKDVEGVYKGLQLNNCQTYRYRLVTGSANDIMAEEIVGEATGWEGIEQGWLIEFAVSVGTSEIVFDGENYSDGESKEKAVGEYEISPDLQASYVFDYWEVSGDIAVDNIWDSTTTCTVSGAGVLTLHVHYSGC